MRNNPLELHAVPAFPIIAIVRNPFRLPKALSRVPRGSHCGGRNSWIFNADRVFGNHTARSFPYTTAYGKGTVAGVRECDRRKTLVTYSPG